MVRSAEKVMIYPAFVCVQSVCLCVLSTSDKNYSSDLREIFITDVSMDEKEVLKF